MENVVGRCQPRCGWPPGTRHYYPFTSVAMNIVHLPAFEVRKGYTVDCCFAIVDGATGYVIAISATLKG